MKRTERFSSLEEVRALRLSLKAERDARASDLEAHWVRFKDKEFRHALVRDGVMDMLHMKNGSGALGMLAQGVKLAGGWLPVLGPLLARRKGILGSRLFWSGLSIALPMLMKQREEGESTLWDDVRNGIGQVKEFMRKQREAHVEEE